jgi:hypothetical protein
MSERIQGFIPQVGIETIDELQQEPRRLPVQPTADLTGGRVRDRVEELYPDSGLKRRLEELAAPRVEDPAITVPTRFDALLRGALQALRQVDPDARSPLSRLLADEVALRDQLALMRSTLLRA